MKQQVQTVRRDAMLVHDAEQIRVIGFPVLESLPSPRTPYELTDPFILVHEARLRPSEMVGNDTKHPHLGFDNLWYVLSGSASTGHTTRAHGSIERAHLSEGSLLWLRTGRGAWHAESIGAEQIAQGLGDEEFRGVLFWVNLARKDKEAEPRAVVLHREQIPVRHESDATVRVLVGDGSIIQLGTPGLILDVDYPVAEKQSQPYRQSFTASSTSSMEKPPLGKTSVGPDRRTSFCSAQVTSLR